MLRALDTAIQAALAAEAALANDTTAFNTAMDALSAAALAAKLPIPEPFSPENHLERWYDKSY